MLTINQLVFFITCVCSSRAASDVLTVTTPSGDVTGIGLAVSGMTGAKIYQFRKIPYAKPPVGNLRFEKPLPYGKWNNTLNATVFGPSCIQPMGPGGAPGLPNTDVSEDCLFLNIYLPNGLDKAKLKSVMVYVHGGGFFTGQGMAYDASYMAVKADVLVVTINYRLNAFGFLSLQKDEMKGNYGLWDQILALQWVHDNIHAFGGDTNSVTVFGESAGGMSVGLLSIIPSNKGLFHRAIAQSGESTCPFSITDVAANYTYLIGREVGCTGSDTRAFVSCLKQIPAEKLLNATFSLPSQVRLEIHIIQRIGPVVDRELFLDTPVRLLSNHSSSAFAFYRSLDVIIGTVNTEGTLLFLELSPPVQKLLNFNLTAGIPEDVFCNNIVRNLADDYYHSNLNAYHAICTKYEVKNDIGQQAMQAVNMYTDKFFLSPSVYSLRAHAESNTKTSTYQYVFTEDYTPFPPPMSIPWLKGAGHGSDVPYLFYVPTAKIPIDPLIRTLSDNMITYWTNFAKYGNPNSRHPDSSMTSWPRYEMNTEPYLILRRNQTIGFKYRAANVRFWLDYLHKLLKVPSSDKILG